MRASLAKRKESFGSVFRKYAGLLFILTLILCALIAYGKVMTKKNAARPMLHSFTPASAAVSESDEGAVSPVSSVSPGTVLTETEPAGSDYLSDALFVGDSLTQGLFLFFPDDVTAIGVIGQNPMEVKNVMYDAPTSADGTSISLYDAIIGASPRPQKLYIMLGANGIIDANNSPESLVAAYLDFCNSLRADMPDLTIVVQSLPPVSPRLFSERAGLMQSMDTYNNMLRDMAVQNGFFFLDVNAAYRIADGTYNQDISYSADGFHFSNIAGYQLWHDYVLSHAVQGEAVFNIGPDGALKLRSV